MEKIEIWEVGSGCDNETSLLTAIDSTETEQELEDILARSPDMLERGLQLVGRQTLMTGGDTSICWPWMGMADWSCSN